MEPTFLSPLAPLEKLNRWLHHLQPSREFLYAALSYLLLTVFIYAILKITPSLAGVTHLPGEDASDKLEAAGTLLKILDTGIFKWGARIFAGVCIMSSAWALKEQRFGIAIICIIGAIIFGTAPMWVRNIFDIADNQSLFSQVEPISPQGEMCEVVAHG